jgi:hypothetical protein
MGSWILAKNPATGVVEEVTGPGTFGIFPWGDRKRGLWNQLHVSNHRRWLFGDWAE